MDKTPSRPPLIAINCDAFTDQAIPIVGVRMPYTQAVLTAGGTPILVPFLRELGQIDQILDAVDGVVLTGGDDLPAHRLGVPLHPKALPVPPDRDTSDFFLIQRLIDRNVPTLAICLGFQQLNVFCGGSIYQDLLDEFAGNTLHGHPGAGFSEHQVHLTGANMLSKLWNNAESITVNSGHHQAIRDLSPRLDALATSADGLVEAAALCGHSFFLGVQWHPERMPNDANQRALFSELIRHALRKSSPEC